MRTRVQIRSERPGLQTLGAGHSLRLRRGQTRDERDSGPGGELSQARQGQDQGDGGQQAGGVREDGGCDEERGRAG